MSYPSLSIAAGHSVGAEQKQSMSIRTLESLRLLQLSSIELHADINQALSTNPFLEEVEGDTEPDDTAGMSSGTETLNGNSTPTYANDSAGGPPHDYVLWGSGTSGETGSGTSSFDAACNIAAVPSLFESITRALPDLKLGERDRCLAELVAGSIDEDGYLRQNPEELVGLIDTSYEVTGEEIRRAVRNVQSVGLPGIGARNLTECLELQLHALPADTVARDLALRIVRGCLELLAARSCNLIAARLKCSVQDAKTGCALIARLSPKPGLAYGAPDTCYVIPDVIVYRAGRRWAVVPNPAAMPRARLNSLYAYLYKTSGNTEAASEMAEQLREARFKLRDIENRKSTILKVAECLIAKQQAFFRYGDAALRAISLKDIAEELGFNPSTISRATSNKYMQTPRGTIPFKALFSRDLETATGGRCSTASIKATVAALIESECFAGAMNDRRIMEALASEGVVVARRTVTKYRRQLGTSPARRRRDDEHM